MNDVSPGGFNLFNGSDFYFYVFNGLPPLPADFFLGVYVNDLDGPFDRFYIVNLAAYSFVKQSQIPSQATIRKSWSALI